MPLPSLLSRRRIPLAAGLLGALALLLAPGRSGAQDDGLLIDVNNPWLAEEKDPAAFFWDSPSDRAWYYYVPSPMLLPSMIARGDFSVGWSFTGGGGFAAQAAVRPWRRLAVGGGFTRRLASGYTRSGYGEVLAGGIWTPWPNLVYSALLGYGQGTVHNRYPAFSGTPERFSRVFYRAAALQTSASLLLWGALRMDAGLRGGGIYVYRGTYDASLRLAEYNQVQAVRANPRLLFANWTLGAGLRLWCVELRVGWQGSLAPPFDPAFPYLERAGTLGLQFNFHDLRPYLE